ncbi:hypothetical protein [Amycolatopsis palatopharyngis]|uniref:hypothetical protein n=1 Tax=Amycolatopsis palatopharyngis TaxID=187982 RepID=UPI000E278A64|nr:hypothetical protein [Amycolatopsis palatopharyngis]
MSDRSAPPAIELCCPDCPICREETSYEDSAFECQPCNAYWPNGVGEPGEWLEPDAEQCEAEIQPLLGNPYADKELQATVERCILDDGHDGDHRAANGLDSWPSRPDTEGTPA